MNASGDEVGADRLGPAGADFYAALIAAHEGLGPEESAALNARLVLILGNLIGDLNLLKAAIASAKKARR